MLEHLLSGTSFFPFFFEGGDIADFARKNERGETRAETFARSCFYFLQGSYSEVMKQLSFPQVFV